MEVDFIFVVFIVTAVIKGVRGTVVAVGCLDRITEDSYKATVKMEGIQSLNNFDFTKEGKVKVHRQYNVGNGKVVFVNYSDKSL